METQPQSRLSSRRFMRILTAFLLLASCAARSPAAEELKDYIARTDSSFGWREVQSGEIGAGSYVQVILTSQTWRGIPWTHQLFVFRPTKMDASTHQAFLYIDGGRWDPKYENGQ